MSEESELGAVLTALSASVVAANQFLQDAVRSVRDAAPDDPISLSLPVPSFAIAEATFDLAYTVARVEERPLDLPALPPRRDVRLGEREQVSLLQGASEETRQALFDLLESYGVVKQLYARVREDPILAGDLIVPARITLSEQALAELRRDATAAARAALDRLLADYQASRAALIETRRLVLAGPPRRILVRIDPEAVRDAGAAVQRARLTFRLGQRELIDVGGGEIVVPE
jgi:hypothetical protein